jgi:oligoribonuclease (3'-5' exoribonuclease)
LNINFSQEIKDKIISEADENVGVLQELLLESCRKAGLIENIKSSFLSSNTFNIDDINFLNDAIREKVESYSTTYFNLLRDLASSNIKVKEKPFYLAYYLVSMIYKTDTLELKKGMNNIAIVDFLEKEITHRDVQRESLRSTLSRQLNSLALTLDRLGFPNSVYVKNRILYILDPLLLFYLKHCDSDDEFEQIPKPWEEDSYYNNEDSLDN